jgi:cell division control protein 12
VTIDVTRLEVEEKGFQMKLNIIDTPGFGDYMNNDNCWVPIRDFIDNQHQKWLHNESSNEK